MLSIVVPFRAGGKSRLPVDIRREASLAMLCDVLQAAVSVGETWVVTADEVGRDRAERLGAATVDDPGGGQGAAVAAALVGRAGPVLILNADLPCVRPSDLRALTLPAHSGALALVEANDGTTNALALPSPAAFAPLYGPGSAAKFRAHARSLGLAHHDRVLPNLQEDVDTLDDLERIGPSAGTRTRAVLLAVRG